MEYRYGSHTVFKIQYHFVFVTKYRYHVLKGDVAHKARELIRQTCEAFEIEILKGVVSKDHIHILVSAPPDMAPSEIMRRIKGRTSTKLRHSRSCASATGVDTFGHAVTFVSPLER